MAGFEQTIIIGNVGRDPEMRYLQSGASVTSFSVAVTTRWTDRTTNEKRERTNWLNVSCWNKLAEIANQYVKKGTQIMVQGTVSARAYMGQDGEPRSSLDLRAENFQLLGGRGDNEGGSNYDDSNNYDGGNSPQDLDDIPF
ncbi:MAG: single-stranded DNA-binding protein [Phototrophicaceae bacterium]